MLDFWEILKFKLSVCDTIYNVTSNDWSTLRYASLAGLKPTLVFRTRATWAKIVVGTNRNTIVHLCNLYARVLVTWNKSQKYFIPLSTRHILVMCSVARLLRFDSIALQT